MFSLGVHILLFFSRRGVAPSRVTEYRGRAIMDPVTWSRAIERDLVSGLRTASADVADATARRAIALLGTGAFKAEDGASVPPRAGCVEALASALASCVRVKASSEVLERRMAGLGIGAEARTAVKRRYEEDCASRAGREAIARGVATHRGRAYDGLEWRLDVQVASRASLVEAVPKYTLRLGTMRVDGRGAREETTLECDYAALKALRDDCARALEATSGAHADRLARYVRRPKSGT